MKSLSKNDIEIIDGYFRATNYLTVGQLYLMDNPLLKRPLSINDIKPRVVGHFGTTPGQNFVYVHLNRIVKENNLNMIYISGPGHGGNFLTSCSFLEGSFTNKYPKVTKDEEGMKKLFKMFSFPYGISSHTSVEVPGSMHEGGELGYSLAHAYGAVLDNPSLIAACVIGDGEAETGPLAASWRLNKIINSKTDGIVLPILHLNGYKISNPTIFGRMTNDELYHFFVGMGYKPYLVAGNDTNYMHERMAKVLDMIVKDIKDIKKSKETINVKYPVLILKTPKGWFGPKEVEGTFKSHQVPLVVDKDHLDNLKLLEIWLQSYKPYELFDNKGTLKKDYCKFIPSLDKCMGNNDIVNSPMVKELVLPDYKKYEIKFKEPLTEQKSDMMELSNFVRDIISLNKDNFLTFTPDEALSNRLNHVFEVTNRKWNGYVFESDECLSKDGRVVDSVLSEHLIEGLLEGYILTGRYGFISSYEAFMKVASSMSNQFAKWLKMKKDVSWRNSIPSLNYVLTSHAWQQDHNGFTHQNPSFLNDLANYEEGMADIYLPIDSNSLIYTFNKIITTKDMINVVVASKHPSYQILTMKDAKDLVDKGMGILDIASNTKTTADIILACAGDTPTFEVIMASRILREWLKDIKVKTINIISLMELRDEDDKIFDRLFTKERDVIFAFHGYPSLVHELLYNRCNHNIHVFGYSEVGSITTPFDMKVRNKIDRYHLVLESLKYLKGYAKEKKSLEEWCYKKLEDHEKYIKKYGEDMPDIKNNIIK